MSMGHYRTDEEFEAIARQVARRRLGGGARRRSRAWSRSDSSWLVAVALALFTGWMLGLSTGGV